MSDTNEIKPRYMDTEGTSIYSGISVEDLEAMRQTNRGPTFIDLYWWFLYDPRDVDEWMDKYKITPTECDHESAKDPEEDNDFESPPTADRL